MSSDICKFVDNTKIGHLIKSDNNASVLQGELDGLYEWSRTCMMTFYIDTCNIQNIKCEKNNLIIHKAIQLYNTSSKRDLGVDVSTNLKPGNFCIIVRNCANRILD